MEVSARRRFHGLIAFSLLSMALAALALAGCSSQSTPRASESAGSGTSKTADPLVTAVLAHLHAGKPAPIGGTVTGYLVDWEVVQTNSSGVERSITELVVTSDGSLHSIGRPRSAHWMPGRPNGAFGMLPEERLGPEPADAAATRVHALSVAQRVIDRLQPEKSAAAVLVFDYLIQVKCDDGTIRQVWVTPSGQIDHELAGTWLKEWPAP
jgi:hypothetical protein